MRKRFFIITIVIIVALSLTCCGKIDKQSITISETEKAGGISTEKATPSASGWITPGATVTQEFSAVSIGIPENWPIEVDSSEDGKAFTINTCEESRKESIVIVEFLSPSGFEQALGVLDFVEEPKIEYFTLNGMAAARSSGYMTTTIDDHPIYVDSLLFRNGPYLYMIEFIDYTEDTSVEELRDYEDVLINTIIPKSEAELPKAEQAESSDSSAKIIPETDLYSDDKVDIIYAGKDGSTFTFKIKNKTDKSFYVYANSLAVDGISSDDVMLSSDIAPQSTGIVKAKCDDFRSVDNPSVLSGDFRFAFNDYMDSFNAEFSNVELNKESQLYVYSANISIPDGAAGMQYSLTDMNGKVLAPETVAENPQSNADGTRSYMIHVYDIQNAAEGLLYITWILPDGTKQNNAEYPVTAHFTYIGHTN